MKEREEIIPRVERVQLNQSQFMAELEMARRRWVDELEGVVDKIKNVDKQRLGVDNALLDNQRVRYYREDIFDENGEKMGSRLFFEPEPKGDIGFKTANEGNKS